MRLSQVDKSKVEDVDTDVDTNTDISDSEKTCPECKSDDIKSHGNETVCEDCGLVIAEDFIDRGPDWRAFDSKERDEKSRIGAPETVTMHDKGLNTVMGNMSTAGMSRQKKERLERIREWNSRSKYDEKGRGLKFALGEIQRMVSALEVSKDIHERAAKVFREAHDQDLVQGRSFEGMATAAIYIACREHEFPRTFDEMEKVSRVDKQRIVNSYRKISSELGIHLSPPNPDNYVKRYLSRIGREHDISSYQMEQLERNTRYIIRQVKEQGEHLSRSPPSVVSGAIYLASSRMGLKLTQKDVSEPCNVGAVTVRTVYNEQKELLGMDG